MSDLRELVEDLAGDVVLVGEGAQVAGALLVALQGGGSAED